MAKPISSRTIWAVLAGLFAVLVAGAVVYQYMVSAKVAAAPVITRSFAVRAIAELQQGADSGFATNVFFKTNAARSLPQVFDGQPTVPFDPNSELGKQDFSSPN